MNREIKFRAWDVAEKRMVTHGFFGFAQTPSNFLKPEMIQQSVAPFAGIESGEMVTENELNGWYLMQYTGLKDKNGVEIYEGDLSKNYYKGEWVTLEVCWNPLGMWSVKWKDGYLNNYHLNNHNMETIGNIFENPELL